MSEEVKETATPSDTELLDLIGDFNLILGKSPVFGKWVVWEMRIQEVRYEGDTPREALLNFLNGH